MITSAPREAGLSLGSNLGDRVEALRRARLALAALPDTRLVATSSLYETEPVGVKPEYQHLKFLNGVLILATALAPEELHRQVCAIEAAIGRERGEDKFAPRTIDIDLLFAGPEVRASERLTLPHPRWARRRFVLEPLAEVRPDLRLPGTDRTVAELLAALPPGEAVVRCDTPW